MARLTPYRRTVATRRWIIAQGRYCAQRNTSDLLGNNAWAVHVSCAVCVCRERAACGACSCLHVFPPKPSSLTPPNSPCFPSLSRFPAFLPNQATSIAHPSPPALTPPSSPSLPSPVYPLFHPTGPHRSSTPASPPPPLPILVRTQDHASLVPCSLPMPLCHHLSPRPIPSAGPRIDNKQPFRCKLHDVSKENSSRHAITASGDHGTTSHVVSLYLSSSWM